MTAVTPGTEVSLNPIAAPQLSISATMMSHEGRYAELIVEQATSLAQGSLIQFETPTTLYLGEVEAKMEANQIRVLIDHSVDLARATAIRRLWNTD
jgi:hypothetical protein